MRSWDFESSRFGGVDMASIQSAGVPEISGVTIEIVTTTGSTSPEAAQAIESNSAAVLPLPLQIVVAVGRPPVTIRLLQFPEAVPEPEMETCFSLLWQIQVPRERGQ